MYGTQCNTMQWNQCNGINAMERNAIQRNAMQCNYVQINTHSWLKYYAIYQHPELGLLWEQKCTGSVLSGIPDCAQQRDLYGNVSIETVFLGPIHPQNIIQLGLGSHDSKHG